MIPDAPTKVKEIEEGGGTEADRGRDGGPGRVVEEGLDTGRPGGQGRADRAGPGAWQAARAEKKTTSAELTRQMTPLVDQAGLQ